ncbi:MAG: hypothetical protein BWX83_01255 [Candidatus Cloacimonetes bacterium ADurb.Bin117]|nr:MAG: hypothetical protein BWX83_01255 [Candidatus Cloacimonetes bacterium ADurb.Bin117]
MDENATHQFGIPADQELEIGLGDEAALDVQFLFPDVAQDVEFDGFQGAGGDFVFPEPPGDVEQVDVQLGTQVQPDVVVEQAGFQDGHVEGFAVEGDQHGFLFQKLYQAVERADLSLRFGQEELLHHIAPLLIITQSDHKGDGLAAPQPRCFEVQNQDFLRADPFSRFQSGPAQKDLRHFLGKEGQPFHLGEHIVKRAGEEIWVIRMRGKIPLQRRAKGVADQLAQFKVVVFAVEIQAQAKKATPKGGYDLFLFMTVFT